MRRASANLAVWPISSRMVGICSGPRFAKDSPLEGSRFELQSLPQTGPFGRTRTVSGRQTNYEGSAEYPFSRGTGSSNPSSSREESSANFLEPTFTMLRPN
jgi:hypothetical protein